MLGAVRTARATIRSFRIYYGDKRRAAAMDRLYSNFVRPGDLVFDVGAHVGDRVASFHRLGVRDRHLEVLEAHVRLHCSPAEATAQAVGERSCA